MKLYKKRRRDWSHHRQWRLVGRCSHSRFVALTNRIESRHPISSRKFKFKKREKMPSETRKLGLPPRASLPSSFRTGKMTIKSESFFVANHFVIELYFFCSSNWPSNFVSLRQQNYRSPFFLFEIVQVVTTFLLNYSCFLRFLWTWKSPRNCSPPRPPFWHSAEISSTFLLTWKNTMLNFLDLFLLGFYR